MSIERPTFHESWHRVANLRLRLRCTTQVVRQHFRGRLWHVVQDPGNNQHFRLSQEAYCFLGLLDGQRTVAQVWELTNTQLGDYAPTQGEVIQLLGQLHAANLLQADLPPDAQNLFDRYQQRVRREVGGYFLNLLFPRIPLLNPERFLSLWEPVVGWLFSWVGLVLWGLLLATGFYNLTGRWNELLAQADPQLMLDWDNLLLLYLGFALVKIIHEFGHAFATKRFGRRQHTGGNVHTMGIMLLVLIPTPYVDASSAWMLRDKWQRIVVGAAGMYVELAVAAVAAVVWAHTSEGMLLHSLAYNMLFVASVSTVLFNANPLLRYDGYYMLSDWWEIPNLAQRSKEYLYYLVRRYLLGVTRARHPAAGTREKIWLSIYGVMSGAYRLFVSVMILFYIADKLFFLGALLALGSLVGWVFMPIGKFVKYLATGPELQRVRRRAVAVSAGIAAGLLILVGLIPVPDWNRAEGLVEPARMAKLYMAGDGFVTTVLPTGEQVQPDGAALLTAEDQPLLARRRQLLAERRTTAIRLNVARTQEIAAVQSLQEQLGALDQQIAQVDEEIARLALRAPFRGQWVAWESERLPGTYLKRGQLVGTVASLDDLVIRVAADQTLGPRIQPEVGLGATVELRVKGRPDLMTTGTVQKILPAGQRELSSAAMSLQAGGSLPVRPDAQQKTMQTTEPVFEILIQPAAGRGGRKPTA